MKGTLSKTSRGWVVNQVIAEGTHAKLVNLYPLHPDNIPTQAEDHFWIDGKEVDFEVVLEIPHDLEPTNGSTLGFEAVEYAKILTKCYCGHTTYCDCGPLEEDLLKDWDVTLNDGEPLLEHLANEEFKKVGDDGLFPNHTDKDIWTAGFKAGYFASKNENV